MTFVGLSFWWCCLQQFSSSPGSGICIVMTKKFLGTTLIFWCCNSLILGYSFVIKQSKTSHFQVLNAQKLDLLGFYFWTPSGTSHHQAPYKPSWIPAALGKRITCWLRDDKLTIFFPFFKNVIFPKFLGSTLIMPHSGVPTMVGVLSLPYIIIFIKAPFFKMYHHQEKLQQLVSYLKLIIPVLTTQEKIRSYLH